MKAAVDKNTNEIGFSLEPSASEVLGGVALRVLTSLLRTPVEQQHWILIAADVAVFQTRQQALSNWCTEAAMRAWSSLAHSDFMRCLKSTSVMHVLYTPFLAVFPTHCSRLDLNPANLESAVEEKWILAFLFLWKWHFFQWRHSYVIITYSVVQNIDRTFYNFSVTRIVRMVCAKNYEKLSKFVKVTAKILSVHFFRTQCTCIHWDRPFYDILAERYDVTFGSAS